jgi:predicted transcriptional regulator
MTQAKTRSEEAVAEALPSRGALTTAEIASATGMGRSTVGKALAALERAGAAHRSPGGHADGRQLPDHWSLATRGNQSRARLRPGELDRLVLEFFNALGEETPVGVTGVAEALGRSAGAVGNCLARLATAGQLEQVSEHPRRYCGARRPTKETGPRRS